MQVLYRRRFSVPSFCHCYSSTVIKWDPNDQLKPDMKHRIEEKWRAHVERGTFREEDARPKSYILSMFPYPSGSLHMGHVRVYAISDTIARFYRMNGFNVLHPMGWDAFGLPAENAATERGVEPSKWTEENIAQMRAQLKQLGCSFDWDREINTSNPDYYGWTQSLFLLMHKAGLVYHKPALVNWDPVDETVLANEQVDTDGNSWRSGAKVEKKILKQWFIRATRFSESLYKGLSSCELRSWHDIIKLQKAWIGSVSGTTIDWHLQGNSENLSIPVWTSKPEHILQASFIAVSPGSLLDIMQPNVATEQHTISTPENCVIHFSIRRLGLTAKNPFTDDLLPIIVVEGLFPFDGADSYMGVPSASEKDHQFSQAVGIPVKPQSQSSLNFMKDVGANVCSEAQRLGIGGYPTSARIRDWLISRQRYWGTPIPIVHCGSCGAVPVPEDQLPVLLPVFSHHSSSSGRSRLILAEDWLNTSCPKCGGRGTRETDTMDTFVDSSWYFLRFTDPHNRKAMFDPEKTKQLMPVDVYIGGKEHAVLHLYFARLISHFLHEVGLIPNPEPFKHLLVQGMVMGRSFRSKESGRYLKLEEVDISGEVPVEVSTGQPVLVEWEKMSKSKHNGVNPADIMREYGTDTTRLLMLADVAPTSHRKWSSDQFAGVLNWQNRMYLLMSKFRALREKAARGELKYNPMSQTFIDGEKASYDARNMYLRSVTFNYRTTRQLSVAVTSMQALTSKLRGIPDDAVAFGSEFERAVATLITVLAPMAPHFASELWEGFISAQGQVNQGSDNFSWNRSVLEQTWPEVDTHFPLPLIAEVNNVEISTAHLPRHKLDSLNKDDAMDIVLKQDDVKNLLQGKEPVSSSFVLHPSYHAKLHMVVPGIDINVKDFQARSSKGKKAISKGKRKEKKGLEN